MEIQIKTLKFDADQKLVDFVEKKVSKLSRFHDGAGTAEVTLSLQKEGKSAKLQIHVPGEQMVIERSSKTFEDAITECVDLMKEKLTRAKEKRNEA